MKKRPDVRSLGSTYALLPDVVLLPDGSASDVAVFVEDGRIAAIRKPDAEDEASGRLHRLPDIALVPGILDIHHHIIEPFAKGLTGGEPAQLWKRFWLPLEAASTPESVLVGAKWTFLEALRGGITTIVDHGIRSFEIADAIHRAADETGIRLVSSTGAYDLKNFSTAANTPKADGTVGEALKIAERHVKELG